MKIHLVDKIENVNKFYIDKNLTVKWHNDIITINGNIIFQGEI